MPSLTWSQFFSLKRGVHGIMGCSTPSHHPFLSNLCAPATRHRRLDTMQTKSFYCFVDHRNDYVMITDANNKTIGEYCGNYNDHQIVVAGNYVMITFHSDYSFQRRFLLSFSFIPIGMYNKHRQVINIFLFEKEK